jgi:hypothetical protein
MPNKQSKGASTPGGPTDAHLPVHGPRGLRLAGNLGPGTLYPGVGKIVQRTGQPLYCGSMTGRVFGVTEHPNTKDNKRTSSRFAGQFLLVNRKGQVIRGYEAYLPGTVERAVKAALKLNPQGGEPIPVSIEVWCEPDEDGRPASPLGYSYVSYDRAAVRDGDPLLALAYEAGILERPATTRALAAPGEPGEPGEGDEIDPETGEVIRDAGPAQAA